MTTDRELLAIEVETLWVSDERGRLLHSREGRPAPAPAVAIGLADGDVVSAFSADLPDALAQTCEAALAASSWAPEYAAGSVRRVQELLEAALGPVHVESGPSYLLPPRPPFATSATLLRSEDEEAAAAAKALTRPENWDEGEWADLLAGELGPWAMAVDGTAVLSLCHSARFGPRGAEAGVWTHPGARGRGLATAVTAAWAASPALGDRHRFYSTEADNIASQRVAAKLGARQFAWTWRLRPTPANPPNSAARP